MSNMITKPTKYSDKWLLKELKEWLKTAKENKEIVYIKQLCEDKRYCFEDIDGAKNYIIKTKKPLYKEISRAWQAIKNVFEGRIVDGAIKGKYNSNISQLYLKHNYNWKDKQVIEQHTTIEKKDDKELKDELAEELEDII